MEKGLAVSMTQSMIQKMFESLEGMQKFAKTFLDSGIAPFHFYPKTPDGKHDFKNGDVAKLVGVFIEGDRLGMHPVTAMKALVPVNGLTSVKGDEAKAMILRSGKLKPGTWIEEVEGSIEEGTYKVTITATRLDTEETLPRFFSVSKAKRAGLWITPEMLQKQDGWKKKQSSWYKYPDRMIKYRALGFLARDLFPDVMNNTYTTEEARDMPVDETEEIITTTGSTVIIPDQQFADERSKRITGNASGKIDEVNHITRVGEIPPSQEETETPGQPETGSKLSSFQKLSDTPKEYFPGGIGPKPSAGETQELPSVFHWTEEALAHAKAKDLEYACNTVEATRNAIAVIPGKNTNKKLRIIILAYMKGKIDEVVSVHGKQETGVTSPESPSAEPPQGEPEQQPAPPVDPDDGMEPMEGQDEDIPPNTGFDKTAETGDETPQSPAGDPSAEESIPEDTNKFGIQVPELSENDDRAFEVLKDLYFAMQEKGIMNEQFDPANAKLLKGKYKDMEEFCRLAPVSEINLLLNSIG